jgi:peroxiredoxin
MKALLLYIVFGFILFSFGSCQKEEDSVNQQNTESFLKSSSLAGLLSRTSQNPTSKDNVLDNSSLVSIELPVTVTVDGNVITVHNKSEYQLVQDVKDEYTNDNDIVYFTYPITIRLQNYSTQQINNYNQLHDAIEACGEDDHFDEIDCISLSYPFTINIYDSNNQVANSISVTGNSNLYNFLANLNNSTYVAISYPISAVNSEGEAIVIHSNTELMNFIENSIDDCENSGGGSGETSLDDLLVMGSWNVSYCYYDNENETNHYQGYNYTFYSNGNIIAQKGTNTINGHWDLHDENTYQRLDLNFEGSYMDDIKTNWRVIEYNQTTIKLKKENSSNTDYLTFTKN